MSKKLYLVRGMRALSLIGCIGWFTQPAPGGWLNIWPALSIISYIYWSVLDEN